MPKRKCADIATKYSALIDVDEKKLSNADIAYIPVIQTDNINI